MAAIDQTATGLTVGRARLGRRGAAPGSPTQVVHDGVPESIVLGVGIAVGGSVSLGFFVAVLVSNIPEGLSATAELSATRSAGWIYQLWTSIAVLSGLAAAIGYAVARQVSTVDGGTCRRSPLVRY